ncbi:hypothetical protein EP331_14035 [bacterium]|nr:MAG: hypothetical protein EP331_14035 [bacterium]
MLFSIIGAVFFQIEYVYPQLSVEHPYSDALIYQNLATGNLHFFGPTHITHRIVLPGLVQVVHNLTQTPVHYVFAAFNLLMLILVLWRVYRTKDGLTWAFFTFLVLSLPAFWRGFFLPMTDAFLWGFLTLFWLEAEKTKSNPLALFLLFSAALFSKEIAVLSLIFIPFSSLENKKKVVLSTILPIMCWLFLESYYSSGSQSNYVFQPERWLFDIQKNLSLNLIWAPKYVLSGLSGFLVAYAYRWFITGKKYVVEIAPELILLTLLLLIAPENSPRILFSFTGIMALRLSTKKSHLL